MERLLLAILDSNFQTETLNKQAQNIVKNVLQKCKEDCNRKSLSIVISDYGARTAYYTGLSVNCIRQCEFFEFGDRSLLNSVDLLNINRSLKTLYVQKRSVTYAGLHTEFHLRKPVKEQLVNLVPFTCALKAAGFNKVKTKNCLRIIIEDPKITFERCLYLKRISKARTHKNVYYIDMRAYDAKKKLMVSLPSSDGFELHSSDEPSLLFYYIISGQGYHNGLFCHERSTESYFKWLMYVVIPLLDSLSVVITNKNSSLENQTVKPITRYDSKKDMVNWLKNNKVPCNPNMCKAELYELIQKCAVNTEHRSFDNILMTHGHQVLHLPDHIADLSCTETLWRNINDDVHKEAERLSETKKESLYIELQTFIKSKIDSLPTSAWQDYEQEIIDLESSLLKVDMEIEAILDKIELDEEFVSLDDL